MALVPVSRYRISVFGAVQGVGFRPFVFRLAQSLSLTGFVRNSPDGANLEVEGDESRIVEFRERLQSELPPAAFLAAMELQRLDPAGYARFTIEPSDSSGPKSGIVLPDLATCRECIAECRSTNARRAGYAFTNCTQCGPRYTIIRAIPYDRPNTTMAGFELCDDCRAEYEEPTDRRFHAQPIACPRCGPHLECTAGPGDPVAVAAVVLERGGILALKGIGGFQLLCDARNPAAVQELRRRKHREEKPFAVLFPDIDMLRQYCRSSLAEDAVLQSAAAPIVLLRPSSGPCLASEVCRSSPWIGAMLPYSPLHHLLASAFPYPMVATSGNLCDEPIAISNEQAFCRLAGVADAFLWHNRPIERPCDDSVVRLLDGAQTVLRRARGYAPLPVFLHQPLPPVLAVGAHLKNTVAIAIGRQVFLSQHIGDLDTAEAYEAFVRAIQDLQRLYEFSPQAVVCDLHPQYRSTVYAESLGLPVLRVQHHVAHVAACAAENDVAEPYLGVAWDGTGYGWDGAVWGSEFFAVERGEYQRVAHLRPFRLLGGDQAARDTRRPAFALLQDARLSTSLGFSSREEAWLTRMCETGLQSPWTTSAGRLFDAVAALSHTSLHNRFEGQAPMLLEAAITSGETTTYPLPLDHGQLDWRPLLESLLDDIHQGASAGVVAARFHNALAHGIVTVARECGFARVALSGGVFQNAYLVTVVNRLLTEAGFRVYTHQRVPPNDGGISLGQAVVAQRLMGQHPTTVLR